MKKLLVSALVISFIISEGVSYFTSKENSALKRLINVKVSNETWISLTKRLEKQLERIWTKRPSEVIPEIPFKRIISNGGQIPPNVARKVRKRGIVIVRGVLSRTETEKALADLVEYVFANGVFEDRERTAKSLDKIFWSKAQTRLRQHPDLYILQKALLGLFYTDPDNEVDLNLNEPRSFADGIRIRIPDVSRPLQNLRIIDGGGIERWKDPVYRKVYEDLLENEIDNYDPFKADYRVETEKNEISNQPNFFRPFRGWLSLNYLKEGSLRVIPLLEETTAYWILRPFLEDIPEELFPGCIPGDPLHLSPMHHSLLFHNLIPIPYLLPGDTIWWHEDLIYSENEDSNSTESIVRLSFGPDCPLNREYLRRLRHSFILKSTPPDMTTESKIDEKDFIQGTSFKDLTLLGKKLMGWIDYGEVDESAVGECFP